MKDRLIARFRRHVLQIGIVWGPFLLLGCDAGILDVDDSGILVPEDLDRAGPAAIPTIVSGMVGDYHVAVDGLVRYSALLTDEMIAADNFPTRIEVDLRRIDPGNATLTQEMYTPLHQARFQADTTAFLFRARLEDPDFQDHGDELNEGIALARLYGGYARLWLAELYCWSILSGAPGPERDPETSPRLPDERLVDALEHLEEAEELGSTHGFTEIRTAALVGQARAHLWLGAFEEAASLAAQVPRGFVRWAEYSANDPSQFNKLYALTWGDTERIRWSVGDGTIATRGNERWAHFDQFVELNLLLPDHPGLTAFNSSIPVNLQKLYDRPERRVLMASGVEARLIEAEAAVRGGRIEEAESLINDLRSDYSSRASVHWGVELPDPENRLGEISLTGDLEADLESVAAERARELWLTGDRHTTSRRLRLDPAVEIDLFPPVKAVGLGGGDDIAFPVVRRELDYNTHLEPGAACPEGQGRGSWH